MAMSVVYTTINGRLIQQVKGGQVTKFVSDTLGSVVAEVDDTGQITHTADYWPYGELRTETGTKKSPFGFVGVLGYMRDFADALYVRARYLRTRLARWQTADPIWPSQLAYSYANGRPITGVDPSGTITYNDNCDQTVRAKFNQLCAMIRLMNEASQRAIAKCIEDTSQASGQKCDKFNANRLACFKDFCRNGRVFCYPREINGHTSSILGECLGGPPAGTNETVHKGDLYIGSPFGSGDFYSWNIGGISGRITLLHELAHACGVGHGQYGDASQCQCNDIFACCIFEVAGGRNGQNCVDAMNEKMDLGGCGELGRGRPFRRFMGAR